VRDKQKRVLDAIASKHNEPVRPITPNTTQDQRPRFPPKSPPLRKAKSKHNQRGGSGPNSSYHSSDRRNDRRPPYQKGYQGRFNERRSWSDWPSRGQNTRLGYPEAGRGGPTYVLPIMMQNTPSTPQSQGAYYSSANGPNTGQLAMPTQTMQPWAYPATPSHTGAQIPDHTSAYGYPNQPWYQ